MRERPTFWEPAELHYGTWGILRSVCYCSPRVCPPCEGVAFLCPQPHDLWGLSGPQVADWAVWDISGAATRFVCVLSVRFILIVTLPQELQKILPLLLELQGSLVFP